LNHLGFDTQPEPGFVVARLKRAFEFFEAGVSALGKVETKGLLEREVLELQTGNRGVEQRAREQLGLVREGETFYQFVEKDKSAAGESE
jgi:hypothetical protein